MTALLDFLKESLFMVFIINVFAILFAVILNSKIKGKGFIRNRYKYLKFNPKHTKYDYAYVVNMFWSDYCNIFTEPSYYLKMAKNYLTDPDYCGEASERAYHNAKKRIKYSDKD